MVRLQWLFETVIGVLTIVAFPLTAQPTGGRNGLSFLNLPTHAQNSAIGSNHITLTGKDPAQFINNPALLDSSKSKQLSVSFMPYLAKTRFYTTAYGHALKNNRGTLAVGLQYFDYGTLVQTDDLGNTLGEFKAADYAISLGYGHTLNHFTFGGSVKWVGSGIENYQLWGLAVDWGGVFKHPVHDFTAGIVVKNMGFIRKNYGGGNAPPLPFDVRAGITFKPTYMPVRFSMTAHHLYRFDMVYNDPNLFFDYDSDGNRIRKKVSAAEKTLRHISLGAELLIHKQFRILLGYDHLRRQELRLQNKAGIPGFSLGMLLRIKRYDFSYGYAQHVPGGGSSTFSALINLQK